MISWKSHGKMSNNTRPTKLQKDAFRKVMEEDKAVSVAMGEVGYKKKTAKNPMNLTKSKGWNELMEKYLPDKLLAEKHQELLMVPKKIRHFQKGELETEYEELDSNAISKGLDMGYKLKGKYAPEKSMNVNVDVDIANPQLIALAEEYEKKLKKLKTK